MLPARFALVASLFAGVLGVAPVFAAPPPRVATTADREAARSLADKGFEQYQAGDCQGARASFEQAEARVHAPPHRLFVARCDAKLGQLMAARAIYQEIIAEKLSPDAPPPFREAQVSARGELDEIEIRLPTIEVAFVLPVPGAQVTIDGKALTPAEIARANQVDPGQHKITASAPDRATVFERTVSARDAGGNTKLMVDLGPATSPSGGGSKLPAVVAFSVGGAGVAVGAITGALSLSAVSSFKKDCTNENCPLADQSKANSAKTEGTISTIAFIVGGVGIAAGATILVVRPAFLSGQPQQGTGPKDLQIGLGLGSIGVSGRF